MPVSFTQTAVLAQPGQVFSLGGLLSATASTGAGSTSGSTSGGSAAPQYLVLVGLDRDRYTAASQHDPAMLSGKGHSATFTAYPGSDSQCVGLVFTLTERGYENAELGLLPALDFRSSTDQHRNQTLSLYGFGTAGVVDTALQAKLQAEVTQPFFDGSAFMQARAEASADPLAYTTANYRGTLDIVTRSGFTDSTPGQATPLEVAAAARGFIRQVWNTDGCWVLANNIATAAGASLPLTADEAHPELTPPVGNGEWIVAYNAATTPGAQQGLWTSLLRTGDIVVANNSCGGHIATIVSGFGASATVLDNSGDSANDGSAADIVIGDPRSLLSLIISSDPASVVIYRLDAPVIDVTAPLCLAAGASRGISDLFSVSDPAGRSIVSVQVYDSSTDGSFSGTGAAQAAQIAHSAATALTVPAADLAGLRFHAGGDAGSDAALWLRAFNGSYWGDWQRLPLAQGSSLQAPVLQATDAATHTATVHGGESVLLTSLFSVDAAGSAVTAYTVTAPAGGGHIALNGAADLDGDSSGSLYDLQSYRVSAADLSRLSYVGGTDIGAELLTITAHNGAALASQPLSLSMATVAPVVQGISHWVAPGTSVPLASLFSVTHPTGAPILSYAITTQVSVISWGDNHPSSGGTLQLNGAVDLLAGSGVPPGNYQIAAADLARVSFQAAADGGGQFLQVWANDGAGGVPGVMLLQTVTDAALATGHAATVASSGSLPFSSLFGLNPGSSAGAGPAFVRVLDPSGGGALQLDHDATNLQSKNDLTPGLFVLRAEDLVHLHYTGGKTNGSEVLTLSTSSDQLHWSAEASARVTTSGAPSPHLGLAAQVVAALFGPPALHETSLLGTAIGLLERGESEASLIDAALGCAAFTHGAAALPNGEFVQTVYRNVVGHPPDAGEAAALQALLDAGAETQASLARLACDCALNLAHLATIDLVGLVSAADFTASGT